MSDQAGFVPQDESRLRVLIVDDHSLLTETIEASLSQENGFDIDIANSAKDGLALISSKGAYDVVLLDYEMPNAKGLGFLEAFLKANGKQVALFTGVAGYPIIQRALEMGAAGYIPKTTSLNNLRNVINLIACGEVYLPHEYVQQISSFGKTPYDLKPRELLVLNLLGEGLQNKEISASLDIEETITKMIVRSICQKFEVRNRTQAVIFARKNGLI